MRTRVSNERLPGYTSEPTRWVTLDEDEQQRLDVFGPDGDYIGQVSYVRRRRKVGGSQYGWRPTDNRRLGLTDAADAILRLHHFRIYPLPADKGSSA